MNRFSAKTYQQSVLDSVETYFRACHEHASPGLAFTATTEQLWGHGSPYHTIDGFEPDMPYFCLRMPTGGGKTWLAARGIALINTHLLRSEYSVILWLVPSKAIRDQTLKALRNRAHPYHAALREVGPVTVLDLDEAKHLARATLETSTTIIVATRQAFQVGDPEIRKVYESSGTLMPHFDALSPTQREQLLSDGETLPCSLANVLRLHRPFVIVDEAHNSRTELSFETLTRFRPAGIMELSATPDTQRTPSNVLHSVSAGELKLEEMIKLPIRLETEPDWQQCMADAIARRDELHTLAEQEQRKGAAYLRPLVLIQAERRRSGVETLDVARVRDELIENHRIPVEKIVIATGEERGLEKVEAEYPGGIASEYCPVRFVITQQALAEGWDCPFAYVLLSMAELRSATAIEQLLGRILRQPEARHRQHPALNQSYAYVVSRDFGDTARGLQDRLVDGAGFERREVRDFVRPLRTEQQVLNIEERRPVVTPIEVPLSETLDVRALPEPVRGKISWHELDRCLTIAEPLSTEETATLTAAITDERNRAAIEEASAAFRSEALAHFRTPAETCTRFRVPQLALWTQGTLELFDDPEVLDYPWDLSVYDAHPSQSELARLDAATRAADGGEIDIDDTTGKLKTRFIADLQRDLGLAYRPEHWDEVKLAAWLCRNLPETSVTHASKQAFVSRWLDRLLRRNGFDLGRANRQKFLLRDLLEQRIHALRLEAVRTAYQQTLFGDDRAQRIRVDEPFAFEFNPYAYAPNRDYDGRYGSFDFRKHYYGRVGDFDSREEFECAIWLERQAQKGRLDFWVRNLVRKEGCSFFLQKADGRFYPDFLCQRPDGVILAVEYKGADRWPSAEDDRLIGGLWEELSDGRCRFVMVKDKRWEWIDRKLEGVT